MCYSLIRKVVNFLKERIKELRKTLGLTLEEFGNKLGVTKTTISRIENGVNSVTNQMLTSICRTFDVREEWLRTGDGKMFEDSLDEDEVAAYVAELLDPDNPFADLIIEIMRTYSQLDPVSQAALKKFSEHLVENIKEKKEEDSSND